MKGAAPAAPEPVLADEMPNEEPMLDESPADAPLGKPVALHELGCGHGKCMPGDELPETCLGCFLPGRDFVIVEM